MPYVSKEEQTAEAVKKSILELVVRHLGDVPEDDLPEAAALDVLAVIANEVINDNAQDIAEEVATRYGWQLAVVNLLKASLAMSEIPSVDGTKAYHAWYNKLELAIKAIGIPADAGQGFEEGQPPEDASPIERWFWWVAYNVGGQTG